MKIALCQINTTVGDFENNQKKIFDYYEKAIKQGAELVVFPELTTIGYPPQDLLWEPGFITRNWSVLEAVANTSTIPIILGGVRRDGNKIYNSAVLCSNGHIEHVYDKILLPTYDVFDEDRYFTHGKEPGIWPVKIGSETKKVGIQICEDLWDKDYDVNVSQLLADGGAEMVINISASPYHEGRLEERLTLLREKNAVTNLPFYYCNLVGGQDELIFDGESIAMNADGQIVALGKAFEENILIVDTSSVETKNIPKKCREEKMYRALCLGVSDYFLKSGHSDAVLGLSGGIDSALVACIATDALGADHVYGVSMPSKYSSNHSTNDAYTLAKHLGIDYHTIPIEDIVTTFDETLHKLFTGTESGIAEENIQARSRGNLLMALSNKFGWMVLSTGNKTELALGYCTLYGDMSGGLSVISDLSKTDVYAISQWVNKSAGYDRIPENSINKPPSAELKPGQVDPFDYEIVSPIVDALVEDHTGIDQLISDGADPDLVYDLYQRIRINEYKRRQAAPGLRVSGKAFGTGRRIPMVNHYTGNKTLSEVKDET